MLCYSYYGARLIIPPKDTVLRTPPSLVCMTPFITLLLNAACSPQTWLKKTTRGEKRNSWRIADMLFVKQTSKRRMQHRADQKMVPKEPSVGRVLRGLAGLLLMSTVGFRCLRGKSAQIDCRIPECGCWIPESKANKQPFAHLLIPIRHVF